MSLAVTRRSAFLLVILASLVVFRCSSRATPQRTCPPPSPDRFRPVITVVDVGGNLTVPSSPNVVWDFEPDVDPGDGCIRTPSHRAVKIVWNGPPGLDIKFDRDACVTPPVCKGSQCTAVVKPLNGKPGNACTYKMFAGAKVDDDAEIVVTPCCW